MVVAILTKRPFFFCSYRYFLTSADRIICEYEVKLPIAGMKIDRYLVCFRISHVGDFFPFLVGDFLYVL